MREIKFRAYDKRFNVMLNEIMAYQPSIVVCDVEFNFAYGDKVDERNEIGVDDGGPEHYCITDDQIEIMQFTGLKDKFGTDIYEGDILSNGVPSQNIDVKYKRGAFWCFADELLGFETDVNYDMDTDPYVSFKDCEPSKWATVIGNIYESPDLL